MAGCGCGDSCATGSNDNDPAYRRVLWAVLAINALMFAVEAVAGWIAGSASLQGDALDFLGDAANYGIALFVLSKSLQARGTAALIKGLSMGAFGLAVLTYTVWRVFIAGVPDAGIMGGVGLAALTANVTSAALLFSFRKGDSNRRSVWICSRNDAVANLAVIGAAALVSWGGHGWPDWAVAFGIAGLALSGSVEIVRHARADRASAQALAR